MMALMETALPAMAFSAHGFRLGWPVMVKWFAIS
jgi:hypothetical protein